MFTLFKHPAQVCMTYSQHFLFSMKMATMFVWASYTAVVHAFLPDLYTTSTTDTVDYINDQIKLVGCREETGDQMDLSLPQLNKSSN